MKIRTAMIPELTVTRFRRLQEVVDHSPPYQREGGIWGTDVKAGLIDSIINGFDIPKLYFETASTRRYTTTGLAYQYAVVDGKQRLEAVSSYLADDLRLSNSFTFFEDDTVHAEGMNLSELQTHYPLLARRFLDFELPIVGVTTDSGDLIEELFQRLNASSALTAAERRNAVSGATRDSANALADHEFLLHRSPIKNARFKYRELGAKFLAIEHQIATRGRVADTKADTLYRLFVATHVSPFDISTETMETYETEARKTLDRMGRIFEDNDRLLSSIGTAVVYYLVYRNRSGDAPDERERLQAFEEMRRQASRMAEEDPRYGTAVNVRLREYNALVQSTNDGKALERRAAILNAFMSEGTADDPLAGLGELEDGTDVPDEGDGED